MKQEKTGKMKEEGSFSSGRTEKKKGTIQEMQIADLSCKLFLPQDYGDSGRRYPVVYVNGEIPIAEIAGEMAQTGADMDFLMLSVQPHSWNDDFTPWGAPPFRKGESAPAGQADRYVHCLTEEIKPYLDEHYRTKSEPRHTALIGYSLGGLAALYAAYRTDVFGVIGSLSGSLWYDGFCEYMEKEKPLAANLRVYLSLGKKESMSRNPRMAKVADCTERARDILLGQTICVGQEKTREKRVCLEWNEGGHFHEIPRRFARALAWICAGY